jgi:transposase
MKMKRIPKQEYTAQFKEQAVGMIKSGKSVPEVARALGVSEQTLRNWVKLAAQGKLQSSGAKEITPEQMELSRLRAENARLKLENEILKKATAYFAKDAL